MGTINDQASPTEQSTSEASDSPVIRDYNEDDYRRNWQKRSSDFTHRFERAVIGSLLPVQDGWWVDVGAGYGRILPMYQWPGRKIVLVDYAMNLLEMAVKKNPDPNIHFVAANAYHLPFRDRCFDAALSIHLFAHINAPDRFLGEMARVVRDGSRMVVEYPNKRSFVRVMKDGLRAFESSREQFGDLFYGTHPAMFQEMCERAGLRVVNTKGSGYLGRLLERAPFLELPLRVVEFAVMSAPVTRSMAPRNFTQLVKEIGNGTGEEPARAESILDILACPICRQPLTAVGDDGLKCATGEHEFEKNGRIFDLRYSAGADLQI